MTVFFRPALKGMVREGNNFLQVCKQIGALTKVSNPEGDVTIMREAMGVLQVNLAENRQNIEKMWGTSPVVFA